MQVHKNNADHIYVNLSLINNKTYPTIKANYSYNFNPPLIKNVGDWNTTVVKFSIDVGEVPKLIVPINDPSTNVNETIYTVTLVNGADVQTARIVWVSQSSDSAPGTNDVQIVNNRYYYLYTVQHMINLINNALLTAYNALSSPPGGSEAPYFRINQDNNKIELIAQSDYYDSTIGTPANRIDVYCNQALHKHFLTFNGVVNDDSDENDLFFNFDIRNQSNNVIYPVPAIPARPPTQIATSYYVMTQETSSLSSFSSFKGLSFLSNIPIITETSPPSLVFGSVHNSTSNSGTDNVELKILTDFTLDSDQLVISGNKELIYNANPYRWISLNGSNELDYIELRVVWIDSYDILRPLFLAKDSRSSIKLMFKKKDLGY